MMIWFYPFLLVTAIIVAIAFVSVRKLRLASIQLNEKDEISPKIASHPFTLNPIIWVILVATAFMFIVITYYAANGPL